MTNSSSSARYYLTTPIYYVNARPHLGHAYSTIVCDAIARRKRALGIETWFLTGTDEHGQKIERSAAQSGRTPMEFATAVAGEWRGLWDRLGLTYDDFIRTTEDRHVRGVQKLFLTLRDRGFIYKGSYTGQYCVSDELYVDGPAGTICPDCGRVTETVSEENYFFKLSAFERKLLEFYEANPGFMGPESTRREVISFVRGGLRDLSVSRTSFSWGIPVPGDEKHVIYVWLDALANYITALGYGSDDPADKARFEKFWPADLHLIGKEISRFHCVYWPAFLMAAGIPLPRSVKANGWLLFDQGKMSKSRGNVVRTETVLEVLEADALRYFLLREIPFGQDGGFSFDALVQRYNADLANGYGNLVSRVVNMVHKYFGGVVPETGAETAAETALRAMCCEDDRAVWPGLRRSELLRSAEEPVAPGRRDRRLSNRQCAVEEAARSLRRRSRCASGARTRHRRRSHSHHHRAGLSHPARFRCQGLASARPGRDCRCRKEFIPDQSRVGRIEARNKIWRARAALSPRGKGRSRTHAESRRRKQQERD